MQKIKTKNILPRLSLKKQPNGLPRCFSNNVPFFVKLKRLKQACFGRGEL
jgi:hypothetical protein